MNNRVRVEVGNSKYVISTQEDEAYVLSLAKELDSGVRQLMEGNDRVTLNDALVLCALNYIDMYHKSERSTDHMRSQLTEYLEDASRARVELDEVKRELAALKEKNDSFRYNYNESQR